MNEMNEIEAGAQCEKCHAIVPKVRVLRGRIKREMNAYFACFPCYFGFLKARKALASEQMPDVKSGPVSWFSIEKRMR